jgi:hypothetical protein
MLNCTLQFLLSYSKLLPTTAGNVIQVTILYRLAGYKHKWLISIQNGFQCSDKIKHCPTQYFYIQVFEKDTVGWGEHRAKIFQYPM